MTLLHKLVCTNDFHNYTNGYRRTEMHETLTVSMICLKLLDEVEAVTRGIRDVLTEH